MSKKKLTSWSRPKGDRPSDRSYRLVRTDKMSDKDSEKTKKQSPSHAGNASAKTGIKPGAIPKITTGRQADPTDELIQTIQKMLDLAILKQDGNIEQALLKQEERLAKRITDSQQQLLAGLQKVEKEVGALQEETGELKVLYKKQEEQLTHQDLRLIAMEDRDRRANIRIRSFEEQQGETLNSIRELILAWVKQLAPQEDWRMEDIERAHRVGFGKTREFPRDIIVKFANYYKKEKLMQAVRSQGQPTLQATPIEVFQDLCPQTVQWRKSVRICTGALKMKSISYNWGYPVFLRFKWNGKQHRITSCEQGIELLEELGIMDATSVGEEKQDEGAAGGSNE